MDSGHRRIFTFAMQPARSVETSLDAAGTSVRATSDVRWEAAWGLQLLSLRLRGFGGWRLFLCWGR
jgi:hypothetical protein